MAVLSSLIVFFDRLGMTADEHNVDLGQSEYADARAISIGRENGADAVMIAHVAPEDTRLRIELRLYTAESGQLLGVAESRERVSLMLDRAVAELARQLVETERESLSALAARKAGGQPAPESEADTPPESVTREGVATPPPAEDPSTEVAVVEPDLPRSPRSPTPSSADGGQAPLLALSLGLTPQAPVHESATYFGFSWGASIHAGLYPGRNGLWSIGVSGRVILSEAQGASARAFFLTVPFGLTAELAPRLGSISPVLRVTGGAAYMRAESDVPGGPFTSIVPYAAAEFALAVPLIMGFSLQIGLGGEVLILEDIVLLGVYPALSFSYEL
jgi:hypothetical protein